MRSQKIRDSACQERCTVNIVGVCNYDPNTTIYAHLPDESHGMALKASDLSGCYACSNCHDVIDGRVQSDEWGVHSEFYMRRAMMRTWGKLFDKGILRL